MAFSAWVGQSALKTRLGSILQGEPGHAYVFSGPAGIGKMTFARELAKALLCTRPGPDGACGQCQSCRHFEHQVHPDFRLLQLEPKDKTIKVERIRHVVSADLPLRPQLGSRKVYLIEADYLNEQGQNALLKSLEEPPDYITFILTANGPERLLPTILSRVTLLALHRYSEAEILAILRQQIPAGPSGDSTRSAGRPGSASRVAERMGTPDATREEPVRQPDETWIFYARYAGGLPGAALELAASPWFADLRQDVISLYRTISRQSRASLLTEGYRLFEANKSQAVVICDILTSLVRDQLVFSLTRDDQYLTNRDQLAVVGTGGPDVAGLLRAAAAIQSARRGLALNASFEGLACNLLLKLRKELAHA